jgi:hypothetical protein
MVATTMASWQAQHPTKTNSYGQSYSGNDDFRGWLAGNGGLSFKSGNGNSFTGADLLLHAGNNGRSGNTKVDPAVQNAYSQWQSGRKGEDPSITAANLNYAATMASIAAQPKLIYRDTNAAWQQAQNTAAVSINPVYVDNMNRFIAKQTADLTSKTGDINYSKTAADTTLTQTKEDIGTNRTRTAEDTASAIAQNLYNEGNWQTQEGAQNAVVEEQARLALGDQGIMGRGAGQLQEAKITRNQTSDQQTKAFQQERDVKKLLETRTFADLETKGTRAVQFNTTEKADLDRQLGDYITGQGLAKQQFTVDNELARIDRLFGATEGQYKTDTASWLASLAGTGARSQDIALATQLYGSR